MPQNLVQSVAKSIVFFSNLKQDNFESFYIKRKL